MKRKQAVHLSTTKKPRTRAQTEQLVTLLLQLLQHVVHDLPAGNGAEIPLSAALDLWLLEPYHIPQPVPPRAAAAGPSDPVGCGA